MISGLDIVSTISFDGNIRSLRIMEDDNERHFLRIIRAARCETQVQKSASGGGLTLLEPAFQMTLRWPCDR
jgi:hypothetical protein